MRNDTEFWIADTFTDSLARLTGDEQKAVETTAFDCSSTPPIGMSFHKLDKAKDKNFWSVRVNSDIRLIVHRSEQSLLLCYAVCVFNGPSPIVRSLKSEADETKAVGAWIAEQAKSGVMPLVRPLRSAVSLSGGPQGQSPGQKTHRRGSLDRIWGPSSGTGLSATPPPPLRGRRAPDTCGRRAHGLRSRTQKASAAPCEPCA